MRSSGPNRRSRAKPARSVNPKLKKIFAPTFVARPPSDAYIGLCKLRDGEIRHYNYGEQRDEETWYIYSCDGGITWKPKPTPRGGKKGKHLIRADQRSPVTGRYLRLTRSGHLGKGYSHLSGVVAIQSGIEHDGRWTVRKIRSEKCGMLKPPIWIRGGKRILVPTQITDRSNMHVVMLYSDDEGRTWRMSRAVTIPDVKDWAKHARWNHGPCEPSVVELKDHRLWALMRTGRDNFWESFSHDGGETWSTPRASRFFACKTMPTMARLDDGRILLIWCNTTPLPPLPRSEVTRILMGNLRNYGINTDMFTNRDVIHAAISEDDGKTWIGFRELFLNPRRNAGDYAMTGGIDRGVHQSQFAELGDEKVLVAFGQHLHRAMVIFDLQWLYEKQRENSFTNGLKDWSVHTYFVGVKGHRALNRKEGGALIAHPSKRGRRVLHLCRPTDPELITENQGAVWNFPAATRGSFTTRVMLKRGGGGFRISLIDRWFNPTDLTAHRYAMFNLTVAGDRGRDGLRLKPGKWYELRFEWDGLTRRKQHAARLYVNGKLHPRRLPLNRTSRNGVSYVQFISTAQSHDPHGFLIESVNAEVRLPPEGG